MEERIEQIKNFAEKNKKELIFLASAIGLGLYGKHCYRKGLTDGAAISLTNSLLTQK